MTRYRWPALVLIVALPVASAAGCGGDEESSQTEAPTRQEFIAQADAICRSAGQDLQAAKGDAYTGEETEFIREEVPNFFQRQIDEIRELTPAPGDKEKLDAALSAAERDSADLLEDQSRVPKGWQVLDGLLERWGSKACAR